MSKFLKDNNNTSVFSLKTLKLKIFSMYMNKTAWLVPEQAKETQKTIQISARKYLVLWFQTFKSNCICLTLSQTSPGFYVSALQGF